MKVSFVCFKNVLLLDPLFVVDKAFIVRFRELVIQIDRFLRFFNFEIADWMKNLNLELMFILWTMRCELFSNLAENVFRGLILNHFYKLMVEVMNFQIVLLLSISEYEILLLSISNVLVNWCLPPLSTVCSWFLQLYHLPLSSLYIADSIESVLSGLLVLKSAKISMSL